MKPYQITVLILLVIDLCVLFIGSYQMGKHAADRWYAAHPRTTIQLQSFNGQPSGTLDRSQNLTDKDSYWTNDVLLANNEYVIHCSVLSLRYPGEYVGWTEKGQVCHADRKERIPVKGEFQ